MIIISVLSTVSIPFLFIGDLYLFGEEYQIARLQHLLSPTGTSDYIMQTAKFMRENAAMLGSSQKSLEFFLNGPTTDYLTDLIVASMCSIYGVLLTAAMIAALLWIILKTMRISLKQTNQLGMIIGFSCGIVFFIKTAIGLLVNLQLIPYVSVSMPFLSYGGSSIIISYILLGLILSVYRYKNILPAKKHRPTRKHLKLKITWE